MPTCPDVEKAVKKLYLIQAHIILAILRKVKDEFCDVGGLSILQCAALATPEPAQKRALESTNPAAIGVGARH